MALVGLQGAWFGSHCLQQKQSWSEAARLRIQLYLNGPLLLPMSGSDFGALTQPELSVASAPGD